MCHVYNLRLRVFAAVLLFLEARCGEASSRRMIEGSACLSAEARNLSFVANAFFAASKGTCDGRAVYGSHV